MRRDFSSVFSGQNWVAFTKSAGQLTPSLGVLNYEEQMELAKLILEYISVIIWPFVTLILAFRFHDVILSLLPKSKIKFTMSGVTVEVSLDELEKTVSESFRGEDLTSEQWDWLHKLQDTKWVQYNHNYYEQLRPLRNSGLIKEYPEGWLSNSESISITALGRLMLSAYDKNN